MTQAIKRTLVVLVGCLAASTALSQTRAGNEFQVNTYTAGDEGYPSICRTGSDQTIVVWEGGGDQDGDGRGIFAQRYGSNGAAIGAEFQANTYTVDEQQLPSVACGANGFVVAWESKYQDGDTYGVFAQRFGADGVPSGSEFQVNTHTVERQLGSTVCVEPAGDFVVVWHSYDQDGDGSGVFGQRFASGGERTGTEFQINTYTVSSQGFPALACDSAGNFAVVWHSDGQDGDSYGVFGQRFASSGAPSGTEFQVNTYTYYYQLLPAIAARPNGDFVVVWESYDYQDGDSSGVFGQRFASGGARQGGEFQVNTYTAYSQEAPAVSATGSGFTVAWSSAQDGYGYGVFAQQFGADGSRLGVEFQVNTYTTADQGAFFALGRVLGVAGSQKGDFVIVWQSTQIGGGQDGYGVGVFGQAFAAPCLGDVDQNGRVSVDELIRGVLVALDQLPAAEGAAFDRNGDGDLTIDELVAGVGSSVNGCTPGR
jgi:hypothetical protein